MGKPNPYKGIPRSEWPKIKAAQLARADAPEAVGQVVANAFAEAPAIDLPPEPAAAPASPPRVNSEPEATAIPRNLFSGFLKQLDVIGRNGSEKDPIPGYRLYWFNDIGPRIAQAKQSGWELVNRDEVILNENLVPGNNDLGTAVSKVVNPNLNPPTRAFLMKKPNWLDQQHQAEREQVHQRTESALKAGTLGARPENRQYTAQAGSSLPKIETTSNFVK